MGGGKKPSRWGPPTWRVLHQLARLADRYGLQAEFYELAKAFRFVFPCGKCRISYKIFVRQLAPMPSAQVYMYHMHNMVNKKLKVPHVPPLDEALAFHRSLGFRAEDLWTMLYFMAYNFYDNGETNKVEHYVDFMMQLGEFLLAVGLRDRGSPSPDGVVESWALGIAEHLWAFPIMVNQNDQDLVASVFVEMARTAGVKPNYMEIVNCSL
jgi:hypothetical protein